MYKENSKVLIYKLKVKDDTKKEVLHNNEKLTRRKVTLEELNKLQNNKQYILFLSLDDLRCYLLYQNNLLKERCNKPNPDDEYCLNYYIGVEKDINSLLTYENFQTFIKYCEHKGPVLFLEYGPKR